MVAGVSLDPVVIASALTRLKSTAGELLVPGGILHPVCIQCFGTDMIYLFIAIYSSQIMLLLLKQIFFSLKL